MFIGVCIGTCSITLLLLLVVVDFSVMVLSSVAWPYTQGSPFNVPGEVGFLTYINHVTPSLLYFLLVTKELHEIFDFLLITT